MQVLANKIPGPRAIKYLLIFVFIRVKTLKITKTLIPQIADKKAVKFKLS
jgi:hypothetical protein